MSDENNNGQQPATVALERISIDDKAVWQAPADDESAPESQHLLWHRQPNEPVLAHKYFMMYARQAYFKSQRGLSKRSLHRLCKQLRLGYSVVSDMSSLWNWKPRAEDYDLFMLEREQVAFEAAQYADAEKWATRRAVLRETEWQMAESLIKKVQIMLDWPMWKETTATNKELTEAGMLVQTLIIREPATWSMTDLARMLELASKLARLAAGMETARTVRRIDFTTMSDDELKQLIDEG